MRVHELAKEYGIKSTEFVDIIQSFGIDIKSHLSSLDDAQVSDIRFKVALREEEEKDDVEVTSTIPDLKSTSPLNKEVLKDESATSIGDTIGSDDTVVEPTEPLNIEEVKKEIDKNIKVAGQAREKYAEAAKISKPETRFSTFSDEDRLETEEEIEELETSEEKYERQRRGIIEESEKVLAREQEIKTQQVIVEKPRGFWAWLKSIFS